MQKILKTEKRRVMPRRKRIKSASGIYHIMLRGINRQIIFTDGEDYRKFLDTLAQYKEECGFDIFAWCLMSNHVHLLLRENDVPLEQIFRKIGARYVYWYNCKHERTGHLFQDRFKSEVITNNSYFMNVVRYIHMNPVKAGICSRPEEYPYSSYRDYFRGGSLVNASFLLGFMTEQAFYEFHKKPTEDRSEHLELREDDPRWITDEMAASMLTEVSGCHDPAAFQALPAQTQQCLTRQLLGKGVSLHQASRVTGLSLWTVRKCR